MLDASILCISILISGQRDYYCPVLRESGVITNA